LREPVIVRPALTPARIVATVFLPFAGAYFLAYLYRATNAVIGPRIADDLGLGAESLGLLTSAYFLAYAALQLPVGIALDRWGPRLTEAALLTIAAAGALLFAAGEDAATLAAGRALIGIGVASCLMAGFKANFLWWPQDKLPLANGAFMSFGALGALAATAPLEWAAGEAGWRLPFIGLSAMTLAVAAWIWLAVPAHPGERTRGEGWGAALRGVVAIFADRLFWRMTPVLMTSQAAAMAYLSLWAGPWLRDVAGYDAGGAADVLLWAALAMGLGFVGGGALSALLKRVGVAPMTVVAWAMAALLLALLLLAFEAMVPGLRRAASAWWAVIAFASGVPIICYAVLSHAFPPALAGRVNTALNVMVFIAVFIAQWAVGALLDHWPGGSAAEAHRAALLAAAGLHAAALAWFIRPGLLRESGEGELK
jgi:predicted MFS family arabinose efflux permease